MTKDETMMSLWDYRGHADYNKDGQRVYAEAAKRGITVGEREVPFETHRGKVMTYPKWFLDEYFHKADPKDNISAFTATNDDDDLPF